MARYWRAKRVEKELQNLFKDEDMKEITEVGRLLADIEAESMARLEKAHYTEPQPIVCKWCGSTDVMKYGIRNGVQNYICRKCKRKFTAKDTPYHMQTPTEQIGAALNMFYDGLSLSAIARHLEETYKNPVNPSTVYRWILRYTSEAIRILDPLTPNVSETWVVDETVIKVAGYKVWFWDIIDADTRFLLASHLSRGRTILDVAIVMQRAWKKADKAPRFIISDAMPAYTDGIERVFGADALHIQTKGITHEINTNIIERFHGTVKDRTKVLRGFKTPQTAKLILNGFLIHYNFFRPHMTLRHKTPAEMAGIKSPAKNWIDVVRKQG